MAAMKLWRSFWSNTEGYAVVEATILFPIILMTFAGVVLLSMYLPTRAVLQRETQYAATVLATVQSDTWLDYDKNEMEYYWRSGNGLRDNVYVVLLSSFFKQNGSDAETIVRKREANSITSHAGNLEVSCEVHNYVIYKEIAVTATRTIPVPVNLSLVNFPREIPITVTSTAVVQNGDEFVRDIDIAKDFLKYLDREVFHGSENGAGIFSKLSGWVEKAWKFLGV